MKIHIKEMIMYKGGDADFKYGVAKAYHNHNNGKGTRSEGEPIIVRYVKEEKKYLVVDGYHRIVKGLLEGKKTFECKIDWFHNFGGEWWLPPKGERFVLEEDLKKIRKILRESV